MTEKTPDITNKSQRLATLICIGFMLFMAGLTITGLVNTSESGAPFSGTAGYIGVFLTIIAGAASWFSYKGYPQRSITALLGLVMLTSLIYQYTQASSGLLNGLLLFTVVASIATVTLSGKWIQWVLRSVAITAVLLILIDLFGPTGRPVYAYTTTDYILFAVFVGVMIFATSRAFNTFSLQNKMLITFIGLMVLAIGTITLIITDRVENVLTERVGEGLLLQAHSNANLINTYFHEKVSQIQVLAFNDVIKENVEAKNDAYTGNAQEILSGIVALDEQWIAADENDPLLRSVLSTDPEINEVTFQLSDVSENLPDHIEVFVTDRYGATVASNNRLSDYYQADEDWWQAAWNDGQGAVYISDPEFDESANANALLIAVPIYSEASGEVLGIMRSTLIVDSLFTVINELQFGETGHTVLFSRNGTVIYDPQPGGGDIDAVMPAHEGGEHFNIGLDQHGEEAVFGHTALHAEEEVDRSDQSLAGQIATAVLDLGWIVVARQQAGEALAEVSNISRTIQLIGLIVVGLTSVVAIFLSRAMVRPLQALAEAAQGIGAGQLNVTLPKASDDEIGQLSKSFSQMVTRLRGTLGTLQARTNDLSLAVELGHELTQVGDLEQTLANAVERIRDRFQLYYAQIYLVDPVRQSLILRTGTGEAGRRLVERGHRLVIGPGSINGTAAANQEAVVVTDTMSDSGHRVNPLLPETRSELAVPLIAQGELIGVLDLQSEKAGGLSEDNIPGFIALAAQLAVAIQNASLFSKTQQAQAEVEAYSHRLANEGWQGYLNGIDRSESLAAAYDLTHETALPAIPEPESDEQQLAVPIKMAGYSVGSIRLSDEERDWTSEEQGVLTAVAEKISRHIENLRLLTEAEEYRNKAEAVAKRLTRQGWETYREDADLSAPGYVYDQQQVAPLTEDIKEDVNKETAVSHALMIGGEPIGEMAISGLANLDPDANNFVQSITEKVSGRIEALRLSHQIELSLDETTEQAHRLAILNEVAKELNQATTADDAYKIVAKSMADIVGSDRSSVALLDSDKESLEIFALDGMDGILSTGTHLPVDKTLIGTITNQKRIVTTLNLEDSTFIDVKALSKQGINSVMNAPLIVADEVLGTLNVASLMPNAYGSSEENMLSQISSLLAATLERRRLARKNEQSLLETTEQARRLAILNEVSRELNQATSAEDAYKVVAKKTSEIVNSDRTSVALLDSDKESLEIFALDGIEGILHTGTHLPVDKSLVGFASKSEQVTTTLILENSSFIDVQVLSKQGVKATMNAPLMVSGEVLGTLNVASLTPNAYGPREENLLAQIATLLAATLESRRLFEQAEKRASELETVAHVSTAASTILQPEALLQSVVDLTKRSFDLYHVHIYLFDDREENLVLTAGAGEIGKKMVAENWRISLNRQQSLVARSARLRESMIVDDVYQDVDYLPNPLLPETRAEVAIPMMVGDQVLGVMDLQASSIHYFKEEDVRIYSMLAAQVAVAMQNARQYDKTQRALAQTQRQAQRMALLAHISEKITVADSLDEIYQIAANETTQLFPSDRVTLSLLNETGEKAQVIALGGDKGNVPIGVAQPISGSLTEKAVNSRKAVIIHDPSSDSTKGINSSMIVPLISGTNVIGTINVASKQMNLYDDQDENLTFQVASLLSAAIENKSLYAEQEATVKRLTELDELKSSFLANMSHELRTPLNSVIGFTDVMLEGLDGPLTDEMEADLQIIQSNGHHLLNLIDEILDMAKIEAGRMELTIRPTNLHDMLNEVVATTVPLARGKGLDIGFETKEERSELEIQGDAKRIKQVLLNLVSNAIKFTESGSVSVEADRIDDLVQIRVRDTGAGIEPNQIERIFEAFRQADNSATRKAGGTGLGLPISRRLVEIHGGRLWAESEVGAGSTFFIELPIEVKRPEPVEELVIA